jgi:Spy/CpxP family protein refolding chaperone
MRISKIAFFAILLAVTLPAIAQEVKYKTALEGYGNWNVNTSTGWQNLAPSGTWWRNQSYITSLSLTPEQQKRMDDVFQQSRIKLIDVTAALDKEEAILEPLIEADRLDENKVALQLDKVADARAELEKANARMLLGIRQVLTIEQWTKLNSSKVGFYREALKKNRSAEKLFGVGK